MGRTGGLGDQRIFLVANCLKTSLGLFLAGHAAMTSRTSS